MLPRLVCNPLFMEYQAKYSYEYNYRKNSLCGLPPRPSGRQRQSYPLMDEVLDDCMAQCPDLEIDRGTVHVLIMHRTQTYS